jgi:hypothetical protein
VIDLDKEGVLEIFNFSGKHVLFCNFDGAYISGLVNRGASVWLDSVYKNQVYKLKEYAEIKNSINFISDNSRNTFDFSIANGITHVASKINKSFIIKDQILLLGGGLNVIKWHFFSHRLFMIDKTTLYSVVPSLSNVRLVIPDMIEVPVQRYWTLRSRNPLLSIKLIVEWHLLKNYFFRKYFFDKLIVVKC